MVFISIYASIYAGCHPCGRRGEADALELAQPLLTGRFLLLCADDIHGARALAEAADCPLAILAARHPEPQKFGVIEIRPDGTVHSLEEKPSAPTSNLVSTGAMVLDERIFTYEASRHANGERYLTDLLSALAVDAPVHIVLQEEWIPVGYPADIERAESILAARAP